MPTASYTPAEELANALTHGLGVVLGIVALGVLCGFAARFGGALHITAVSIYATTLILLYAASTLYHSVTQERVKQALRALDHSAIYLLIAGTYTPFCLLTLQGAWGLSLLAAIWTLALVGIALRLWLGRTRKAAAVAVYVVMGWLIVFALKPLLASLNATGLSFLLAGGLTYTLGVVFYVWRSLPYHHAIWHLFVLVASTLHFFAVFHAIFPAV
ncbi:MAG: hemolysin III family protein [Gammaproteobacteria bacterium]|nr:hemolysin III family protein [Gammaproteobacteria bacterium]